MEVRLYNFCNTQIPKIPISFENVTFTKPTVGPYVQMFFLDSVVSNPDIAASGERERGLFQISVCQPIGTGIKAIEDLVSKVKGLYPVLPKTGTVSIERPPQSSAAFARDDGFIVIPITVSYRQER